ncbi:RDD family protein [Nocardia transvalensis]|uniref:RDD family protein n=1 Tax=Nocardia transvalensis TaxID=37333 RepID=UPI00189346B9|nr:RDD family protein [Nocardia transvalensis]MBF6331051.1 RDD family protein [Nocardia transvalensis]
MTDPHAQQPFPQQPGQPGHGYPPPGHGMPGDAAGPPGYGTPPGYGAGQPVYGTAPNYGAGQPGYGTPPGYGPGQPGFGAPPPGYGAPQPGYGAPPPGAGYGYPAGPGYQPYGYGPPYASWPARVGGAVVDALIVGVPAAIFYSIGIAVGSTSVTCTADEGPYSYSQTCSGGLSGVGVALIAVGGLIALVGGLYLLFLEGRTGQTPGKKVVGIRLVREADGQPLGFGMALVRRICHILDTVPCYLGWLWPLWDDKRQTFADKILNTIVVKV